MTCRIQSPDTQGRIDPPVERILRQLPPGNDVTVVPVTRLENFQFGGGIKGPWVLWDHSEFGWDWDQTRGYVWGVNRLDHPWFQTAEWNRFDDFVREHPPLLTFQRELLASERDATHLPAEYLNYSDRVIPETREQFEARPVDVMFQWGRSSESRVRLHANIFRQSSYYGYEVVGNIEHLEAQLRETPSGIWVSSYTPHYARRDVREIIQLFGRAKIVVSMGGCGQKTFRGGEIPNSIIAFPADHLAWSIPYKDGGNCLRLETGLGPNSITHDKENVEVKQLYTMLQRDDLYWTYREAVEMADRLRPERYMAEYVVPEITKRL